METLRAVIMRDGKVGHTPGFLRLFIASVDHLWDTDQNMPSRKGHPLAGEMLQGTLDLLILQTLVLGPAHGPHDRAGH